MVDILVVKLPGYALRQGSQMLQTMARNVADADFQRGIYKKSKQVLNFCLSEIKI
jgi:hypothetical protein